MKVKRKFKYWLNSSDQYFTKEDSSDMPHKEKQYRYKLPVLTITTEGVGKLLKNIVTSKACGPDNIPKIFLKNCSTHLAPGLRAIFRLSVDSEIYPKTG